MRKFIWASGILGLVLSLLVVGCGGTSGTSAPTQAKRMIMNMGTTSASSSLYIYGVTLAKIFNDTMPEIRVTAVETGGGEDNLQRLLNGEINIASIMAYGGTYEAFTGTGAWKNKTALKGIRHLLSYGMKQYGNVVRADSGVQKPADLEGKPFSVMAGSFTESSSRAVFSILGIKPDWKPSSTADAVTNIKDRRWIGYSKAMGSMTSLDSSTLDIMSTTPIRLLSFTKEQMEKVKATGASIEWYTVPANGFKQLKEGHPEIICYGSGADTIVLDTMPAELTYKMTKAMYENYKGLSAVYEGVLDVSHGKTEIAALQMFKEPMLFATGAVWFLEEKGITVPKQLIPPEYKPRK